MITSTLAPASLPEGERVYAIGDVHGCVDNLRAMHALIRTDLAARPIARPTIVHLGDYVDRGPDSAGVIGFLREPWSDDGTGAPDIVNLMGNHEDMMLNALSHGDARAAAHWIANGGTEALQSWGISHRAAPETWWGAIPPLDLGFLRGLSLLHRVGGYVFVHAGVRPAIPLERQSREDLLWIREPFLSWDGPLPYVVVHGHTPADAPAVLPHRVGVDTGAVLGGALTCAVLEMDTIGFIQT